MSTLKQHKIPFFKPSLGEEEIQSVVETLRSGWLTTGPKTKEFERQFAERVGATHAIAVNSATAALTLALEATGIQPGDEVIVPSLTFASTGEIVIHLGGIPVLADCRVDTLNLDPAGIESKITDRTRAIIPVHYGGQPCDMNEIHELAQRHNLAVIEDAAHAIPAAYRGRTVGSISPTTCFSFYANKTMTTGEGGMITTCDDQLAERMRIMSLHGISKDAWKRFSAEGSWYYEITAPGFKMNMTDIAASLGLHQMRRADGFWERRQEIAQQYNHAFNGRSDIRVLHVEPHVQMSWHLYVIRLVPEKLSIDRNTMIQELNEAGIGTSVHYMPLHMHPYYRERFGYQPDDLPTARAAYEQMISLPIYPAMTEDDVRHVIQTVQRVLDDHQAN